MRIGIVFHKNPLGPPTGIDLVRLRAIAGGLRRKGIDAEIIAPVEESCFLDGFIPVRTPAILNSPGSYDLVKTSYHYSVLLLENYRGPVVSRIVRVVDDLLPERDEPFRKELLYCQKVINQRAVAVVMNNRENLDRWKRHYGKKQRAILVPTGCPSIIPPLGRNPYPGGKSCVLFLGSLAAPRMVKIINETARLLEGACTLHVIGADKTPLYGGDGKYRLDGRVVHHGEIPEDHIWDYIRWADVGLALATGPHGFDNDLSKIFSYLRGGLPVLSEDPVLNNNLLRQANFGKVFEFGDIEGLVEGIKGLIDDPPPHKDEVMNYMAKEHSWEKRVETYIELFETVLKGGSCKTLPERHPGESQGPEIQGKTGFRFSTE